MEPLYYCEKCGKPVYERIGKYDTGRFCSISCANSRIKSEETKKKISDSNRSNYEYEEFNGKMYTKHKAEILKKKRQYSINKREGKLRLKSTDLYKSVDVENSPYSDYDSIYYLKGNNCYQFIKHNENNTIVKRCTIPKYRYEIEYKLGRKLNYTESIHHIDGNHNNDNPDNLIILHSGEHTKIHNNARFRTFGVSYPLVNPLVDPDYDFIDPLE